MFAKSVLLALILAPVALGAPKLGENLGKNFQSKLKDGKLPTPDISRMANAMESPKTGKVQAILTLALVGGVLATFVAPGQAADAVGDWLGAELGSSGFFRWQLAGAVAMALNLWAVNQPGRLDGEVADRLKLEDMSVRGTLLPPPDAMLSRSKFQPAGWAFGIWGAIFAGETLWHFLGQFAIGFLSEKKSAIMNVFAKTAPSWIACCLLQSIWCATFRPTYRDAGPGYLLVPAVSLFASAGALANFHYIVREAMLCNSDLTGNPVAYLALLPHTIHFAWLLAASLVNTNGALAHMPRTFPDSAMTKAAIVSAGIAAVITGTVSINTRAPVVALVGAWSLAAISADMSSREAGGRVGYVTDGVKAVKVAARVGAGLCVAIAILALIPDDTLKNIGLELPIIACQTVAEQASN